MPALLAIIGALGAAAFWYYRLRDVGHAAHEVLDAAQRARGAYRRKRFRHKAESSPIEAVDDPAAAAVAMLIALASERGTLSPAAERAIKAEMEQVIGLSPVDEVFTFAKWVADHATDSNTLSLRFSKLWLEALQPSERMDLHAMAARIAAIDGEPTPIQVNCLKMLKDRLALTRS
ncbi:hypothetical protein [Microvirga sp. Mcv34]|uniref:hypothetical protein n=1 Tax=Microvirga sp. Mcv34 TaxID=2926016 RepID=UPI0021C6DB7B|nr:hypothetical protein [Microvirga sp. Mcv34]